MCIWEHRTAPDKVHEDVPEDKPIVAYKMVSVRGTTIMSAFIRECIWDLGKWKRKRLKPEHTGDLLRMARAHFNNPYSAYTTLAEDRWMGARVGFYAFRHLEDARREVILRQGRPIKWWPHGEPAVVKVELSGRVLAYHKQRRILSAAPPGFIAQKCRVVEVL